MKTIKDVQVKRPGLQTAVQNDKGNSSFYMPAHALAMYLKPRKHSGHIRWMRLKL
jgi:hypothetical protein